MKTNLLFVLLTFLSLGVFAQQEGGPIGPPPCPPMQNVEFCFTNSTEFIYPCEKTVCMTFVAKPSKQSELAGCFYDPSSFCITLSPGGYGCINIPSPGLPITDWYDLQVTIRSSPTGATPAFALEPKFLNSNGTGVINGEDSQFGGCNPNSVTFLFSDDGYHYIIKNTLPVGTGG